MLLKRIRPSFIRTKTLWHLKGVRQVVFINSALHEQPKGITIF